MSRAGSLLWAPPCRDPKETDAFLPRTIGKLEPSYVIRKFLDAQRIHNLTAYLQTLHLQSLANADHTTLLLNCYTKLKDIARLEEFIKVRRDAALWPLCQSFWGSLGVGGLLCGLEHTL